MPPFEQISISFIDKRDKALDQALSEFSAETLPNLKRKDYEMDEEKPCKEVSPQNVEGCKRFRSIRDQSFEKLMNGTYIIEHIGFEIGEQFCTGIRDMFEKFKESEGS